MLAETDAPFLTPAPTRGMSNAPAQVAHTVRALAAVRQLDVAKLCAVIEATGERVFGPWRPAWTGESSRPEVEAKPGQVAEVSGRSAAAARLLGPTEIRGLAARLGLQPSKRLGQNFVVDAGTVTRITALAKVE